VPIIGGPSFADAPVGQWHKSAGAPILRSMTAEPIRLPADPGRKPAAIRDMLPAADRAEFAAALEEETQATAGALTHGTVPSGFIVARNTEALGLVGAAPPASAT
jgi:hypothetical protein